MVSLVLPGKRQIPQMEEDDGGALRLLCTSEHYAIFLDRRPSKKLPQSIMSRLAAQPNLPNIIGSALSPQGFTWNGFPAGHIPTKPASFHGCETSLSQG